MSLICKLFGFILNLFVATVEGVGFALRTVGTVLVDTAGGILGAAGDALNNAIGFGGMGTLLLLGGIGYFLLTRDDEKDKDRLIVR